MPIYEYQCGNCKHKLECIQKIDDDPMLTCPKCDQDALRKLVSAASFRLKGTGWYVTDFKDKPEKKEKDSSEKETSTPVKEVSKSADKKETKATDSRTA